MKTYHVIEHQRMYAVSDAIIEAENKDQAIKKYLESDFDKESSNTTPPYITSSHFEVREVDTKKSILNNCK